MAKLQFALGSDVLKRHLFRSRRSLPGPHYCDVLGWLHQALKPKTYVEIGVETGSSLLASDASTICIGIDPMPKLNKTLSTNTTIYEVTSNEFFERYQLNDVLDSDHFDLAFIDGSHLFEQALRDFVMLERFAAPHSVVVLHDCLPLDTATSERERKTEFYSGDVWKVTLCLKENRPDLELTIVPTWPTGLCIIRRLDRASTILVSEFDRLVERYLSLGFEDFKMRESQMPRAISNSRVAVVDHLLQAVR
jgi:predicted O-methyltransferase YrrM